MKRLIVLFLVFVTVCESWSVPKPMESIENYNVMLIHGAYGKNKGFLDVKDTARIKEAYVATKPLDNGAALGRYHENLDDEPRLLHWLTTKVFDEPEMNVDDVHPKHSYVYQWRSFSNPANSSYNNAFELGDRMWYMPATRYEHRRSMGGVVAREYVQNSDYYYGDVDKIITLDSPHEGTGALNMQIYKEGEV